MFLRQRSRQAEYTDAPDLSAEVVASNYRELARVNRVLMFTDPFQRHLVRWLGPERCRELSILDLGAGDGRLGLNLSAWAGRQGWRWTVTNLDMNPLALRLAPRGRSVAGAVQALPFADGSFDVVIALQMTHHLDREETVVAHFREAWRVTRDALYISDVHRNAMTYAMLWVVLKVMRVTPLMSHDGLVSVKRGWRIGEWEALARAAGLDRSRVWLYYGSRIMLQARKGAMRKVE